MSLQCMVYWRKMLAKKLSFFPKQDGVDNKEEIVVLGVFSMGSPVLHLTTAWRLDDCRGWLDDNLSSQNLSWLQKPTVKRLGEEEWTRFCGGEGVTGTVDKFLSNMAPLPISTLLDWLWAVIACQADSWVNNCSSRSEQQPPCSTDSILSASI